LPEALLLLLDSGRLKKTTTKNKIKNKRQLKLLFLLPKIGVFLVWKSLTALVSLGEVFAICGSCDALGNWNPQNAVALINENETGDR
jgi:hypothetical protein